jgi:hypothetical protein
MSEINRAVKHSKIDSSNLKLGYRLACIQGTMPKMNKILLEEKNRIKIRDMLSKHKSPSKKKRGETRSNSTLDVIQPS